MQWFCSNFAKVDVVGSVNDWQKERQFKKLNEKKEDRQVKVIRAGQEQLINIAVCIYILY
jgi:hypothetical protein